MIDTRVVFSPCLLSPSSHLHPRPPSSLFLLHRACTTSARARGTSVAAKWKSSGCGPNSHPAPRRCCGGPRASPLLRRAAPLRRPQLQGAQAPGSQTDGVASHCA